MANTSVRITERIPSRLAREPEHSSLIIAPQWIGDAVMTEPLLARLHARGERLSVGALPWVAPVYRAMPQVSEVIEFPFRHGGLQWRERQQLARSIAGRFSRAYVLPNSIKSALLPLLAGIPVRIGYLGETRVGLLTHRLKNPPKAGPGSRPPMVAFYSALAGDDGERGRPGFAGGSAERPRLVLDNDTMHNMLARHGLQPRAYIALAPGAEFGPAKRWPTEHVAALVRDMTGGTTTRPGIQTVLLGSAKEAELCAAIAAADGMGGGVPHVLDLASKTTLDEAMALIAGAAAILSNDSGLMHVAAAFGVPQVAVFGSTSPHHTPPLNDRARVIWLKDDPQWAALLECSPCFERDCPLGHQRCLTDIRPERVAAALRELLGTPA